MASNFTDSEGKILTDDNGDVVLATGTTVPADASTGYATGCIFTHTDGTGANCVYNNVGTTTSSQFVQVAGGAITLTPTSADTAGTNVIPPGVTSVRLGANVNGVTDYTVLPALADVPNGHCITIIAGAANSEVRTPAASAEEINSEDCDGTKEYLLTGTTIHRFTKIDDTIGWMGQGWTAIGAVVTAVIPD